MLLNKLDSSWAVIAERNIVIKMPRQNKPRASLMFACKARKGTFTDAEGSAQLSLLVKLV